MKRALLGFLLGVFTGWGASLVFRPLPTSSSRLVEAWSRIQPGMELKDVPTVLGMEPAYRTEAGAGAGPEAASRFPSEYLADHGLEVYLIKGIGPYLLFVAYDRSGRVTYVSHAAT